MRCSRDIGQLALALCLGTALLVLLLVTGSMALLHTSEPPRPDTYEPPASFVCTSDVAGTLLLCEQSYGAQQMREIVLWTAGSMTS